MASIGLKLDRWRKADKLRVLSSRPTLYGLENHLATVYRAVTEFRPSVVVMDPLTSLMSVGTDAEVTAVLTRLIDFLKAQKITGIYTTLASHRIDPEHSEVGVSSWMDTWIVVRSVEWEGIRRRALYVIKARGMKHSDGIHELKFTSRGISVLPRTGLPATEAR